LKFVHIMLNFQGQAPDTHGECNRWTEGRAALLASILAERVEGCFRGAAFGAT
jgi:hypothetical protein